MEQPGRFIRGAGLALLTLLGVSSCVDERVVFRDRVLFDDPPSEARGMLGYTDVGTKLTVCGNCHVGQQGEWVQTAHADAWVTLEASGQAQDFCRSCHTVNELGNPLDEIAGWNAFKDDRYHDVQCESCHGPGLAHVQNPDAAANQPLAPISVGLDLSFGCGECHQGDHHPFVEEWERSAHGQLNAYPAGRPECASCHEGKGALQAFGVRADYIEKGTSELLPLTCGVCHDPHDASVPGQLRFAVDEPSMEGNLCARCHDRVSEPNPASPRGLRPHSPSAGLLLGEAGWFPPGAEIDQGQIIATHGSEGNPRLCATCHVNAFEVVDQLTGEFVFQATGHVFNAIPCLDEQGIPTSEDCALTQQERSFQGCTAAGCHGTQQAAFSALIASTGNIRFLAEELEDLLLQVDPNLEDAGGEIDPTNASFTLAEGAYFNLALARFGGEGRPSARLTYASAATHNPFLVPELLRASIRLVEEEYGVTASPGKSAPAHLKTGEYRAIRFNGTMP